MEPATSGTDLWSRPPAELTYGAGHQRDPGHVGADLGGRLADALEERLSAVGPHVAGCTEQRTTSIAPSNAANKCKDRAQIT